MNINHIKLQVAADTNQVPVPVLNMVRQINQETKEPTPWLTHWDNANRRRVVMHEEVFTKIVSDPTFNGLALKFEMVTPEAAEGEEEKSPYSRHIVIIPKAEIVGTF